MYSRSHYASSSVNPHAQSAASPYMVPTCPVGYTTTDVKKGPDGTIYSYSCSQYSSRAGEPVCPAGFTMMKHGSQFTCTRIHGSQIQKPWPGPLPPPPPPKRGNPQCQPGQFYSEDLGGCYWPGGGSVAFKPKRSRRCPPGMTWTEDLGCVTIPPVPKFPSLPPAPTCPPGMTWTEDLGCVDMTRRRTKRNPGSCCAACAMQNPDVTCNACAAANPQRPCPDGKPRINGKCPPPTIKAPPGRQRSGDGKDILAMCCDENGKNCKPCKPPGLARRATVTQRVADRVRRTLESNPGYGLSRAGNPGSCCGACAAQNPAVTCSPCAAAAAARNSSYV